MKGEKQRRTERRKVRKAERSEKKRITCPLPSPSPLLLNPPIPLFPHQAVPCSSSSIGSAEEHSEEICLLISGFILGEAGAAVP